MTEQWRPIPGFDGLYEASDQGRIKRVAGGRGAKPGRILRPKNHTGGYKTVTLSKNSEYYQWLVHRLVCAAFLGPAPQGVTVNHKDGDRANNRLDNLEYVSYKENEHHAQYMLRTKGKLSEAQVVKIRERYASSTVSQKQLAQEYSVHQQQINLIVRGLCWKEFGGPITNVGRSKLTTSDVEEIRKRLAQGEKQKPIAEDYGVSIDVISSIHTGRTFLHIDEQGGPP